MTDIGEGRFLPALINAVRRLAPHAHIEALPVPTHDIEQALDRGRIDLAFGFLPSVTGTRRAMLFPDRYIVLMRQGHPFAALPDIIQATDLAVIMPHNIAQAFPGNGEYAIIEAAFPMRDFEVAIHWSQRYDADPSSQWLRHIVLGLYAEPPRRDSAAARSAISRVQAAPDTAINTMPDSASQPGS